MGFYLSHYFAQLISLRPQSLAFIPIFLPFLDLLLHPELLRFQPLIFRANRKYAISCFYYFLSQLCVLGNEYTDLIPHLPYLVLKLFTILNEAAIRLLTLSLQLLLPLIELLPLPVEIGLQTQHQRLFLAQLLLYLLLACEYLTQFCFACLQLPL
jgi:hypothetical protein